MQLFHFLKYSDFGKKIPRSRLLTSHTWQTSQKKNSYFMFWNTPILKEKQRSKARGNNETQDKDKDKTPNSVQNMSLKRLLRCKSDLCTNHEKQSIERLGCCQKCFGLQKSQRHAAGESIFYFDDRKMSRPEIGSSGVKMGVKIGSLSIFVSLVH